MPLLKLSRWFRYSWLSVFKTVNYFLLCAISEIFKAHKSEIAWRLWMTDSMIRSQLQTTVCSRTNHWIDHLWKVSSDFTLDSFQGPVRHLGHIKESSHITSNYIRNFSNISAVNQQVLMIKLSLGHCWLTPAEIFRQCVKSFKWFRCDMMTFWNEES